MDLKRNAKLALVTASSGGIGYAIARSLANEGARVILNGRSVTSNSAAADRLRSEVPT